MSSPHALIGHTGFVGRNLLRQAPFEDLYNSENIESIRGREYELVVCAGASSSKRLGNQNPENDRRAIRRLMDSLEQVQTRAFVHVSTIDVYPQVDGVDEDSVIDEEALQPYGRHRRHLERFVIKKFQASILRLPALFGAGLKKNVIYDLLNRMYIESIHPENTYQPYDLQNLWEDICRTLEHDLKVLNLATEPMTAVEISQICSGPDIQANTDAPGPFRYEMHTKHARLWGETGPYLYRKPAVLEALASFANDHKDSPAP